MSERDSNKTPQENLKMWTATRAQIKKVKSLKFKYKFNDIFPRTYTSLKHAAFSHACYTFSVINSNFKTFENYISFWGVSHSEKT